MSNLPIGWQTIEARYRKACADAARNCDQLFATAPLVFAEFGLSDRQQYRGLYSKLYGIAEIITICSGLPVTIDGLSSFCTILEEVIGAKGTISPSILLRMVIENSDQAVSIPKQYDLPISIEMVVPEFCCLAADLNRPLADPVAVGGILNIVCRLYIMLAIILALALNKLIRQLHPERMLPPGSN